MLINTITSIRDVNSLTNYEGYDLEVRKRLGSDWKEAALNFANRRNISVLPFVKKMHAVAERNNATMHPSGLDFIDHRPVFVAISALEEAAYAAGYRRYSGRFVEKVLLKGQFKDYSLFDATLFLAENITDRLVDDGTNGTAIKEAIMKRFYERRMENIISYGVPRR